jgi:hypothetical protein
VTDRRRTLLGSGMLVAGLVGLAALVVAVVVFTGGDEPPPDDAVTWPISPLLEPPPEPEPEEPDAVAGAAEVREVIDLSVTGSGLVGSGSSADERVPVDEGAVDAVVEAITEWLDAHLTDLQAEGDGLVADVGLVGAPEAADLAGPGAIIDEATYQFFVGVRGEPEWVRVQVVVVTEEGDQHVAVFGFTGRAEPELQGVEGRS